MSYLLYQKVCEICGKNFSAKRNDARFCSNTCRSKGYDKKFLGRLLREVIKALNPSFLGMLHFKCLSCSYEWEYLIGLGELEKDHWEDTYCCVKCLSVNVSVVNIVSCKNLLEFYRRFPEARECDEWGWNIIKKLAKEDEQMAEIDRCLTLLKKEDNYKRRRKRYRKFKNEIFDGVKKEKKYKSVIDFLLRKK